MQKSRNGLKAILLAAQPLCDINWELGMGEQIERREWVEPEVQQLDVMDTAVFPGRGRDGEVRFVDCTRS